MIFDHNIKKRRDNTTEKREICQYMDDIYDHPLKVHGSLLSFWGQNISVRRSCSEVFCMEMITAGNAVFIQNNREYLVQPGEVYLLRKNCDHLYSTGPAGFLHKRCLNVDGPILEPLLYATSLYDTDYIIPSNPTLICNLFRTIHGMLGKKEPSLLSEISQRVYHLIVELGLARKPLYPASIRIALEFMDKNIAAPVSSDRLAKITGLSQTHFNRLFKEHMKTSPKAYFITKKMNLAKYLLKHTQLSIKEIASATGYENSLYFSAQFKKQIGISPKFYMHRSETVETLPSDPCYA
jgi:AraC-like DNA-binding protein